MAEIPLDPDEAKQRVRELLHDVNNTQCGVIGNSDLIEDICARVGIDTITEKDLDAIRSYSQNVAKAASHVNSLLYRVSQIVKNQKLFYDTAPVDLARSVNRALRLYAGTFAQREIAVTLTPYCVDQEPKPLYFMGDRQEILRVFTNLFVNMIRALDGVDDPEINVALGASERDDPEGLVAKVEMQNNGPQLPYDDPEEMFTRRSSAAGSSGLGLAICREIVEEKFGGKIYAEHLEQGAAFYIELPLCDN